MTYNWINNVAKISDDHTSITFDDEFNEIIKPNTLPENLTTLTFGYFFDQKIKSNTLPKKLITLSFGYDFNQKIKPNTLPETLTTLIFGYFFNQKIEPNSLPDSLTTLVFGTYFNQKIEPNMLPINLKYIEFNWSFFFNNFCISRYIEMVNNISGYYDVKIFLSSISLNILNNNDLKWPIHVRYYEKTHWSSEIYDVIDNYKHPSYGDITVLINKETYQPYSFAKSAIK